MELALDFEKFPEPTLPPLCFDRPDVEAKTASLCDTWRTRSPPFGGRTAKTEEPPSSTCFNSLSGKIYPRFDSELANYISPLILAFDLYKRRSKDGSTFDYLYRAMNIALPHLNRFAREVQQTSRQVRDKRRLKRQITSISELVEHAVETVLPLAEDQAHELVIQRTSEPTEACVDGVAVEQALVNLLNNAIKYTEPGGRIEIGCDREGDHVVVRVRDTGIGMESQTLSRAFALFERADDRQASGSNGNLGIGLAFVKRVVELHDGCVHAFSGGIGKGSELILRMPAPPAGTPG